MEVGDRVVFLRGWPSQRFGVVLDFRCCRNPPRDRVAVVLWDAGYISFSLPEETELANEVGQIALPLLSFE
ncbi:hypothetical protein [Sphaerothrix gracilis]|uniref:hypothetical protein n=1 Tax=Sphaerothrix gracilis TaxID=3151835 RepID=UPI0031FE40DD